MDETERGWENLPSEGILSKYCEQLSQAEAKSQELPFVSPISEIGTLVLELPSGAFLGAFSGCWIGGNSAGTCTGTLIWNASIACMANYCATGHSPWKKILTASPVSDIIKMKQKHIVFREPEQR